ncbi:MAG: hypothetical protein Q7T55_25685, partial [Solirubrobacteraceae bacterium]|nr:hypothetical protein [Solirubrobacteraceae bacterium]
MASRSERQPLKPAALIAFLALAGLLSPVAVPAAGAASGDVSGAVSFSVTDRRPDVPTGLTTRVSVATPAGETTPTQLSRLQVTLPDGVQFGAQARTAGGDFRLCDAGAFAVGGTLAAQCPPDSAIGLATITSAGETLTGSIYAGSVSSGGLPSIYVEASEGGSAAPGVVRMKLAGALAIGGDGRPGIVFDQIPAPPFSSLELSLTGGDSALFVTPRACNAYAGVATLTGALTGASIATSSTISVDQDCGARGFAPGVEVASDSPIAEAYAPSAAAVSRADRSPRIRSARIDAPSGLLANIGGMPECGLVGDAAIGCAPSTRIGTGSLVVGLGGQPRTMSGPVYLTPRAPGAVAGAHLVVPVRLGEVSLGDLVVPVRIDLRPTDAGIGLSFDLPDRFRGVDLAIRRAELRFDAPGFTVNPSACAPLGYSAGISSDTGAVAFPTGQLSYSRCDALPFAPTLQATLTGETGPGGHPNVNVALNARGGDSNLKTATVVLPDGIAADLANLKNACPIESFNAVTCSA